MLIITATMIKVLGRLGLVVYAIIPAFRRWRQESEKLRITWATGVCVTSRQKNLYLNGGGDTLT